MVRYIFFKGQSGESYNNSKTKFQHCRKVLSFVLLLGLVLADSSEEDRSGGQSGGQSGNHNCVIVDATVTSCAGATGPSCSNSSALLVKGGWLPLNCTFAIVYVSRALSKVELPQLLSAKAILLLLDLYPSPSRLALVTAEDAPAFLLQLLRPGQWTY